MILSPENLNVDFPLMLSLSPRFNPLNKSIIDDAFSLFHD
jgi:hypothetical protein